MTTWLPVALALWLFQLSEDAGSLLDAARAGAAGWLLGHGVPLVMATGPLGLAPLAVTVLAVWRLVRAGVHASRAIGARGGRSPDCWERSPPCSSEPVGPACRRCAPG